MTANQGWGVGGGWRRVSTMPLRLAAEGAKRQPLMQPPHEGERAAH
jgi:hypothetical protein